MLECTYLQRHHTSALNLSLSSFRVFSKEQRHPENAHMACALIPALSFPFFSVNNCKSAVSWLGICDLMLWNQSLEPQWWAWGTRSIRSLLYWSSWTCGHHCRASCGGYSKVISEMPYSLWTSNHRNGGGRIWHRVYIFSATPIIRFWSSPWEIQALMQFFLSRGKQDFDLFIYFPTHFSGFN